jgi:hypothetical protein
LEKQVQALQALLQERQTEYRPATDENEDESNQEQTIYQEDISGSVSRLTRIEDNQRSQVAVDELGSLMLNLGIEDVGEPSFTIPSHAFESLSFSKKSRLSDTAPPFVSTSQADCSTELEHIYHVSSNHNFQEDGILQSFLDHFNPFHQFVDQEEATYLNDVATTVDPSSHRADSLFLTNAAQAIGAHFCFPQDETQIDQYVTTAKALVMRSCRETPGAATIKGLSLLCWIAMVAGNDSEAWIYNGKSILTIREVQKIIFIAAMATGMILSLGFHTTALDNLPEIPTPLELAEMRSRIRTFWAYFSVDR